MIPYSIEIEKETILHYATLLEDSITKEIIERDAISTKGEAIHLAEFFWEMVERSNTEDERTGSKSDYVLEKIIITFMAYFRSSGYENEWEEVSDRR